MYVCIPLGKFLFLFYRNAFIRVEDSCDKSSRRRRHCRQSISLLRCCSLPNECAREPSDGSHCCSLHTDRQNNNKRENSLSPTSSLLLSVCIVIVFIISSRSCCPFVFLHPVCVIHTAVVVQLRLHRRHSTRHRFLPCGLLVSRCLARAASTAAAVALGCFDGQQQPRLRFSTCLFRHCCAVAARSSRAPLHPTTHLVKRAAGKIPAMASTQPGKTSTRRGSQMRRRAQRCATRTLAQSGLASPP